MKQLTGRILLASSTLFLAGFIAVSAIIGSVPRIARLEPSQVIGGGLVRIIGEGFGQRRGPAVVLVAGRRLPPERYVSWTDTEIRFRRLAEDPSSLVQVQTRAGFSNPALITNPSRLPFSSGEAAAAEIASISPERPGMGETLTISGTGFGTMPGRSRITLPFSISSVEPGNPWNEDGWAASAERVHDWDDTRIVVDLPDGIGAGELRVVALAGESNPVPFLPPERVGRWDLGEPVDLVIGYSAVDPDRTLLPLPVRTRLQPRVQDPAGSSEAVVEPAGATAWIPAQPGQALLRVVRRYPIRTQVVPGALTAGPYPDSVASWTRSDAQYPGDDAAVQRALRLGPAASSSAWVQLQRSYDAVRAILEPDPEAEARSALELLEGGPAMPRDYALLLVTYLRGLGFPARSVHGVVADGESARQHRWVEVYLADFGWMPMDPAAGDGAFPALVTDLEDPGAYYLGSLDAMRVTLAAPDDRDPVPLGMAGEAAAEINVSYLFSL